MIDRTQARLVSANQIIERIPADRLRELYVNALRMRLVLDEKIGMKLRGEHDIGGFFIGGMGEEVHGAALAQALWDAMELPVGRSAAERLAIFPHYRSDALVDNVLLLSGYDGFVRDQFRQQAARATDPSAGGRQMVMHVSMVDYGIQPNQSALGMQIGKAAGYAKGWKLKGKSTGVVSVVVLGDGTTSCSDFHEGVSAAGLWSLPVLFVVTDNEMAISTPKSEGVAIVDLKSYAKAFNIGFESAESADFGDVYEAAFRAVQRVHFTGKPTILHCPVVRFRGHSSSGLKDFDPDLFDPLVAFGQYLFQLGIISSEQAFTPKAPWPNNPTRYLGNYADNPLAKRLAAEIRTIRDEVVAEPKPDPDSIWKFRQPPFPAVREPESSWDGPRSGITVAQSIRAALDRTLATGNAAVWGEDCGHTLGGVFGCTRFLPQKYPNRVWNTPINEPLILGLAAGAGLHPDLALFPEIQFADYSLNTLHWLVHLGHLYWATNGQVSPNVTVRMPSDPTLTGALYHSMSVESYYAHVPSVVIVMPSNSFDAYGLLRTCATYRGPVIYLEPKDLYRVRHDPKARGAARVLRAGPQLPGERPVLDEDSIPEVEDFFVPIGKARQVMSGQDCTVVSYGLALHKAVHAAESLAETGITCDVIDLRTLVPYDREFVVESVRRTGRLVIATEDRLNYSYVNQIVADVHANVGGANVALVGMQDVPATGMAPALYHATVISPERIREVVETIVRAKKSQITDFEFGHLMENELIWLNVAPGWKMR